MAGIVKSSNGCPIFTLEKATKTRIEFDLAFEKLIEADQTYCIKHLQERLKAKSKKIDLQELSFEEIQKKLKELMNIE